MWLWQPIPAAGIITPAVATTGFRGLLAFWLGGASLPVTPFLFINFTPQQTVYRM